MYSPLGHQALGHAEDHALIEEWAVHMVMYREGRGSKPGGVKCFSTRLSFESNSSDISRFMFPFQFITYELVFDFAEPSITSLVKPQLDQEKRLILNSSYWEE